MKGGQIDSPPEKTTLKKASHNKVLTTFDNFQHSIKIVAKSSILDIIGVLNPTLTTGIFALQKLILINLKPIFASYRNRLINSNNKEGSWFYMRWKHIDFKQLEKAAVQLLRDKVIKFN